MRTILIVDDDPISARLVEIIVKRLGYTTVSVPTAEEALERLNAGEAFDLLILDQGLGAMSGLELYSIVHSDVRYRRLPVILCTGLADGDTVREAIAMGIRHVMAKPVTPKVVMDNIAAVETEMLQVIEPKASRMARLQLTDAEYKMLLRTSHEHLVTIRGHLENAVNAGNRQATLAVARRLREPASLLGANRVLEAVARLEASESWSDFEHGVAFMLEELSDLDAAVYAEARPQLIGRPLGMPGMDVM